MQRLINRSIQHFLAQTYGAGLWALVASDAGLGEEGFETSIAADNRATEEVINAAARRLRKDRVTLLEDLGIHLARIEPIRRRSAA